MEIWWEKLHVFLKYIVQLTMRSGDDKWLEIETIQTSVSVVTGDVWIWMYGVYDMLIR